MRTFDIIIRVSLEPEVIPDENDCHLWGRIAQEELDWTQVYNVVEVHDVPDCGDPGPNCDEHNGACD